jgi:solute carrier family 25 protein 39/40
MSQQVSSITPVQQILSACSGAVLTSLLTTPFDVVKVRLQAQQQSNKTCYLLDCRCLDGVTVCSIGPDGTHHHTARFKGTRDAFFKIAQLEGFRAWWKGLSPTLLMAVPMTVIYYSCYDQLKVLLGFKDGESNYLAPAVAGSLARVLAVSVVCPMELVKTKLQSRQGYSYRELLAVVQGAIRQNGVLSLWRGMSPMLLRDVPFSMTFWVIYEQTKFFLSQMVPPGYSAFVPFVGGSIAGGFCAFIYTPLDVVKTHMQVSTLLGGRGGILY